MMDVKKSAPPANPRKATLQSGHGEAERLGSTVCTVTVKRLSVLFLSVFAFG